jgi:CBS domain-containing protein
MKVRDVMSADVRVVNPNETIQEAARIMAEIDAGSLPVGENDRLIGMLTDRDIAIRAVAQGRGPDTSVREAMTPDIEYVFEDDRVEEVADKMSELQVRRLPVLNSDKRLVGIVSLGDIAQHKEHTAGEAMGDITQPSGQHSQH